MSERGRHQTAEDRWLDSLRYGYTDVHRTVDDRHSFDALWADGGWAHDPHPEMFRETTIAPPPPRPGGYSPGRARPPEPPYHGPNPGWPQGPNPPAASNALAIRPGGATVSRGRPQPAPQTMPLPTLAPAWPQPMPQPMAGPAEVEAPPRDRTAASGRTFFLVLFWFSLVTSVELWWLNSPAHSITDTSEVFLAIGRITGMAGGFVLLFQILLMSRVGWLERWIGAHDLLVWHRDLGSYLLVAVVVHVAATIVGYGMGAEIPLLKESWSLMTDGRDMIEATIATALLVLVALSSIRWLRRKISYEKWYYLHLASYAVLVLGYGHQFSAGRELMNPGFGRLYWNGLYLFVLGCLAWGRLFGPIVLNLKHRLKIVDVVAEAPDMVSIYIGGRRLEDMRVSAGQYFRWRFWARRCWWQAHPFSLSAAPNDEWLRLTVKVVGDHTEDLQYLERGTQVFAEGPSGVFTADRRVKRRALLIAGGSGIAPIRALLEDLPAGTIMIYRAGSADELLFREELDWLARERRAYIWYVLGSREEPGPKHLFTPKGMRELVPDITRRDVFLCGPQGLVAASVSTLERLRVPKRQIHLDPFEF